VGSKEFWTEWVGFAGLMMVLIGVLNVIQGLIAIVRDDYYVLTAEQIIVFDLTTWGWILLIWGVIVGFAGWALATGAGWARWFTLVVASLNIILQLGFVGSGQYPLWALTVLALNVLVLYALTVRWSDVEEVRSYKITTTD
jgi:multisubunit Na+/H+ antiporter MnhG subunit